MCAICGVLTFPQLAPLYTGLIPSGGKLKKKKNTLKLREVLHTSVQTRSGLELIPIVVWLEGAVLVQAQVLGLLVGQLGEMCVKRGEM